MGFFMKLCAVIGMAVLFLMAVPLLLVIAAFVAVMLDNVRDWFYEKRRVN